MSNYNEINLINLDKDKVRFEIPNKLYSNQVNFGLTKDVLSGWDEKNNISWIDDLKYCDCISWNNKDDVRNSILPIKFEKIKYLMNIDGSKEEIPLIEDSNNVWSSSYYAVRRDTLGDHGDRAFDENFLKYFSYYFIYMGSLGTAAHHSSLYDGHHVRLCMKKSTYINWCMVRNPETSYLYKSTTGNPMYIIKKLKLIVGQKLPQFVAVNNIERTRTYKHLLNILNDTTLIAGAKDVSDKIKANQDNDAVSEEIMRDFFFILLKRAAGPVKFHMYLYEINPNLNVYNGNQSNLDSVGQMVRYLPIIQQPYQLTDRDTDIKRVVTPPYAVHVRDAHATMPTRYEIIFLKNFWLSNKKILLGKHFNYENPQHNLKAGCWGGYFSARKLNQDNLESIFSPREWINTFGRILCRLGQNFFASCSGNQLKLLYRNMTPTAQTFKNLILKQRVPGSKNLAKCPTMGKIQAENAGSEFYDNIVTHNYGVDELAMTYFCMDDKNKYWYERGSAKYLKLLGPLIQFVESSHGLKHSFLAAAPYLDLYSTLSKEDIANKQEENYYKEPATSTNIQKSLFPGITKSLIDIENLGGILDYKTCAKRCSRIKQYLELVNNLRILGNATHDAKQFDKEYSENFRKKLFLINWFSKHDIPGSNEGKAGLVGTEGDICNYIAYRQVMDSNIRDSKHPHSKIRETRLNDFGESYDDDGRLVEKGTPILNLLKRGKDITDGISYTIMKVFWELSMTHLVCNWLELVFPEDKCTDSVIHRKRQNVGNVISANYQFFKLNSDEWDFDKPIFIGAIFNNIIEKNTFNLYTREEEIKVNCNNISNKIRSIIPTIYWPLSSCDNSAHFGFKYLSSWENHLKRTALKVLKKKPSDLLIEEAIKNNIVDMGARYPLAIIKPINQLTTDDLNNYMNLRDNIKKFMLTKFSDTAHCPLHYLNDYLSDESLSSWDIHNPIKKQILNTENETNKKRLIANMNNTLEEYYYNTSYCDRVTIFKDQKCNVKSS